MTGTMNSLLKNLFCLSLLCSTSLLLAQDTPPGTEGEQSAQESTETTTEEEATTEGLDNDGQYLVVNELGFGVGYPAYQLYHAYYSFQRDVWGVAFKGSYTASDGIYLGVAGRYYPPIPAPVPTFISLGAGITGNGGNVAATFGAHVPFGLGSPARATLEAGLGYSGGSLQFVGSVGVGYTFFVDTAPISPQERRRRELERLGNCQPEEITEPDESQLEGAFDRAIDQFLDEARAQYAGSLSGLNYNVEIAEQTVNGSEATIEADFSGSVTVSGTGDKARASGSITALFGWTGCSWKMLEYDYDVD
jgi:hypothetical protein